MYTEQVTWLPLIEEINTALDSYLQVKEAEHAQLYEAARYAVLGAGKKIRPLLCLAAAEMLGVPLDQALPPAVALEFVHCYSLIHDDLPAMDNDDYRRGRLTLHRAFPEGLAILTGDYLLTYAFQVIAEASNLDPRTKVRLVQLLAQSAGGEGMVGGQVRDIDVDGHPLVLQQLKEIHARKTGRLFKASILFAAVLKNVDSTVYAELEEIAELIGLAFQVADDILDVTKSEEKHGRSSDMSNQKKTYVTFFGVAGAQNEVHKLLKQIDLRLDALPYSAQLLKEIIHWVIARCF